MSIVIENVSKRFDQVQALKDVSFTLEEGKIYGLLGRNGAGKSTLLNVLTQRIFPDGAASRGRGAHEGNDRGPLQAVPDEREALLPRENMKVKDAFKWSRVFYPEFDWEFAWNLAGAFQLNTGRQGLSKLSTGYSSIFKIVVALSTNAPYVLLDEPVLGLGRQHRTCSTKRCWPGTRSAPSPR